MNERLITDLKRTIDLVEDKAHGFVGNYDHEESWYLTPCGVTLFNTLEERDALIQSIREWILKHPTEYKLAKFAYGAIENIQKTDQAPCVFGMVHIQMNYLLQILEGVE